MSKASITDKSGVLDVLRDRLWIAQSVIAHCKAHGDAESSLVNNRQAERGLLEAIRFIEEHAE